MQFEQIYHFKKVLALLKQISRDKIYIYRDSGFNGLHFATINKERTIISDIALSNESKLKDKEESKVNKKISIKTGSLFYDIMDTVEKGSIIDLDFKKNKLNIRVSYDDIFFDSILESNLENFIGFPELLDNINFKISGEKLSHAFNLLSKFKNDLKVNIKDNNLLFKSSNNLGDSKLIIPASLTSNTNEIVLKDELYDYEIIKPILSASKISDYVELMLQYNEKIQNNVIIAKCTFKNYDGNIQYLFTPKSDL